MRHRLDAIESRGEHRERVQCSCGWAACHTGRSDDHMDRLTGAAFDRHLSEARADAA